MDGASESIEYLRGKYSNVAASSQSTSGQPRIEPVYTGCHASGVIASHTWVCSQPTELS